MDQFAAGQQGDCALVEGKAGVARRRYHALEGGKDQCEQEQYRQELACFHE